MPKAVTLASTPTSSLAPLSPGSNFKQVSEPASRKTLADLKLEEIRTKGVVPQWNGKKETFGYSE